MPLPFQVFSDSAGAIDIKNSAFTSNAVSDKGGALFLVGRETLAITGSTFTDNKVGPGVQGDAAGGDIYAADDVSITIVGTTFTGSEAEYGGAAIECCGGSITTSIFSNTTSDMLGVRSVFFFLPSFRFEKLCTAFPNLFKRYVTWYNVCMYRKYITCGFVMSHPTWVQ